MDKNKYPAYNEDDTQWDDHHRKNGLMTNRELDRCGWCGNDDCTC